MALQMGPDNLPGYLPPGTAPFCKCWKETSQVPSCRLCDRGTRVAAMLLCTPPSLTLCPRLGYKKLQGSVGCLVFMKSQAPVWFWLLFCLMTWDLTKSVGALDTLGEKISCRAHAKSCVLYEGKVWPSAADSSPAYWKQKWELKGCFQTDFHSFLWQTSGHSQNFLT